MASERIYHRLASKREGLASERDLADRVKCQRELTVVLTVDSSAIGGGYEGGKKRRDGPLILLVWSRVRTIRMATEVEEDPETLDGS